MGKAKGMMGVYEERYRIWLEGDGHGGRGLPAASNLYIASQRMSGISQAGERNGEGPFGRRNSMCECLKVSNDKQGGVLKCPEDIGLWAP